LWGLRREGGREEGVVGVEEEEEGEEEGEEGKEQWIFLGCHTL